MPWLPYETRLQLSDIQGPVIGVASDFGKHDSQMHQHDHGQLLFTQQGSIHIFSETMISLLPPNRVAWIPANRMHRVVMHNSVDYRSIYLDPQAYQGLPKQMAIYDTSPLIKAVLEEIAFMPFETQWESGEPYHLISLCLAWLAKSPAHEMTLQLPKDKRLNPLLNNIGQLPAKLNELAKQVGASEKTIGRIFDKEVGMNYQQWRQRWRFMKAVELLAAKRSNSEIAEVLDFSSDSAFVAFFKQWSGETPQKFAV